ncbi:MAG TPA: hypothetical protein VLX92_26075 [Kofleriaceae bacterium]|nr:hypothetical protein [Kofleriaceae bacterium]
MRRAVAIAALASCAAPDAQPLPYLELAIVVAPSHVRVFTGGGDLSCTSSGLLAFPSLDSCTEGMAGTTCDDGAPLTSCLHDAWIDTPEGSAHGAITAGAPIDLAQPMVPGDDVALHLVGCGTSATIAFTVAMPPTAQVLVQQLPQVLELAWTTDIPSSTTLIDLGGGEVEQLCRVQDMTTDDITELAGASTSVDVMPELPPSAQSHALGDAVIWQGGDTSITP